MDKPLPHHEKPRFKPAGVTGEGFAAIWLGAYAWYNTQNRGNLVKLATWPHNLIRADRRPLPGAVQRVGHHTVAVVLPCDLTSPVLSVTPLIATAIWLLRDGHGAKAADGRERKTGLLQFLLPRDIFTHPSARVDVALYLFERLIRPFWVLPFVVAIAPVTEHNVMTALDNTLGTGPQLESSYAWMLLYSLVTLLLYDALFYLIHYVEHKTPALWAIHKIHHSAEVLTPLTRYREHVIEGPIYAIGAALAYGIAGGIFGWLFMDSIAQATLFNLGFFAVVFGFNGSFRHYHVAFHYPKWLSRWLHSPVMHHVHHSYLPSTTTKIWPRSPVFGIGCLAPFTSPKG